MAGMRSPRAIEAIAADKLAMSGCECAMVEAFSIEMTFWTASLVFKTATVNEFVLAARVSATTSLSALVPTGKVTTATTQVASGGVALAWNQRYRRLSPSKSYEREPSKMTVAFAP